MDIRIEPFSFGVSLSESTREELGIPAINDPKMSDVDAITWDFNVFALVWGEKKWEVSGIGADTMSRSGSFSQVEWEKKRIDEVDLDVVLSGMKCSPARVRELKRKELREKFEKWHAENSICRAGFIEKIGGIANMTADEKEFFTDESIESCVRWINR